MPPVQGEQKVATNCEEIVELFIPRSQPSSYRATTQDVDYLENQCAREKRPGNCEYDEYEGQDLGFADIQMTTRSQELCGEQCDQTSAFNCRSYSYFPSTGVRQKIYKKSLKIKIFRFAASLEMTQCQRRQQQ